MPAQSIIQIRQDFHVQPMLPGFYRDALHEFAFRGYGNKYLVDEFRAYHSGEILNLAEHSSIVNMIAVEIALEPISEVLILLKLQREGLAHFACAHDNYVASSNSLLDSVYHD